MAMNSNREILIDKLEALELLDNRYEKLSCVNFNASDGHKRGHFSLVFKGFDRLEGKHVAIKFFDPDPTIMLDRYRLKAFEREPELLLTLFGKKRCLQLVSGLKIFGLEIDIPGNGGTATIPCQYFVADWVPEEIDVFFERQHEITAIDKLYLFNEIVLAVEALHKHDIFHRDIKVDNLRSYEEALKRIVVAIDLGTAARFDSASIGTKPQYENPVGHVKYSAPEAFCGLAGHRHIAQFSDVYSLGCLLYELFNKDLFYAQIWKDKNYKLALGVLSIELMQHSSNEEKLQAWNEYISVLRPSITPIPATTEGHSVPPEIQEQLNILLSQMTKFDFRQRLTNLQIVREKIWSMIRVVENNVSQKRAIEFKRLIRLKKEEKIKRHEKRLNEFLAKSRELLC